MTQKQKQAQQPRKQYRRTYIRQWRQARGLTLEELAAKVGLTASALSYLERGQSAYIQDTLEQIARALDTTDAALLRHAPPKENEIDVAQEWDKMTPEEQRRALRIYKASRDQ